MKIKNPFFKKINEIKLLNICKALNVKNSDKKTKIIGINDLKNAKKNEISFFNSLKYLYLLKNTKLSANKTHAFKNSFMKKDKINHIKINIFPDGGISRFRIFGKKI